MKSILLIFIIISHSVSLFSTNNEDILYISNNPQNIARVNSIYDDYNSCSINRMFMIQRLIFSTNRFSKGNNFDLINYRFDLIPIGTDSSALEVYEDSIINDFNLINTNCDELGPYYIKFNPTHYSNFESDSGLFFISRKCSDNLNIYYCKYQIDSFFASYKQVDKLKPLDILNTSFDEGYVSLSMDFKNLYFCSNMFGSFDIMEVSDSSGANINQILYDNAEYQIKTLKNINSDYDEKCPFIDWDNFMVFSSNRSGGFGGYDLYYSYKKDKIWSTPINFGEKINTEYDEYRPIIVEGQFMIFSSNRPEGKGGFDLYIVEIKK